MEGLRAAHFVEPDGQQLCVERPASGPLQSRATLGQLTAIEQAFSPKRKFQLSRCEPCPCLHRRLFASDAIGFRLTYTGWSMAIQKAGQPAHFSVLSGLPDVPAEAHSTICCEIPAKALSKAATAPSESTDFNGAVS